MEFPFEERRFPLDESSIAGHVALAHAEVSIVDVYQLSSTVPYTFNQSYDRKTGYRTKSIFAIPLTDKQRNVIDVLQTVGIANSKVAGNC